MRILYLDTETTGLDPKKNGIIQLSGSIVINGELVEEYDYHLKLFSFQEIDESVFKIIKQDGQKITKEIIDTYEEPTIVFQQFFKMIKKYSEFKDKLFICGYKTQFDIGFLMQFFENNNVGVARFHEYISLPPIDVLQLALFMLMPKRQTMSSFSLISVAKELGIEVDETLAHDAKYDAFLCRQIMRTFSEDF